MIPLFIRMSIVPWIEKRYSFFQYNLPTEKVRLRENGWTYIRIETCNMIVDVVPSKAIDFKFFATLTKKLFNSYVLIPRCGSICVHPFWAHRGNGSIKLLREKRIDSFVQWCNYCTSLSMHHGLDPFPTVTVGPPWGKKIGIGGFRMGKITWKYEENIFNNKRNKKKKIVSWYNPN